MNGLNPPSVARQKKLADAICYQPPIKATLNIALPAALLQKAISTEILQLMRNDIGLLNEERSHVG